ncbi:MAG: hypothetical protein C7B44_12160 [Sulfobacillus thermosulfidooxidans]|uniref:phosphate-starvation-inducible PsiE family protein n=1 Tax=Sulfobacillus TaxID=28033 RepID=UPI000CD234B5|nr:phosphate-starvation-inducible PsiE family protein [Sulfobacillus sp. hq2]POB09886.1 hypothetical protein CO251_13400 [Sulfobacillus sp. hq2]PSR35830.1 MAG: hypothetical protein C7B44_12160 [Sulfobacillus thermosulfidooxidans]
MTLAFTLATALAIGTAIWQWVTSYPHLLGALHTSVDPLMLAFLFAELAHTARVMQSTHHLRPELIIILLSLASARHLLVLLTVTDHPSISSLWASGALTTLFVIVWMAWAIVAARTKAESQEARDKSPTV